MRDITFMQYLEVLVVNSRLPTSISHTTHSLTLNHLRTLDLSLDTPNLDFLSRISCPPGLSLRLTIYHHFLDANVFNPVFNTTCRFIVQKAPPLEIKTVIIYAHSPQILSLRFWPRILPANQITTPYSDGTCLELSFEVATSIDLTPLCNSIFKSELVSELDTLLLYFGKR